MNLSMNALQETECLNKQLFLYKLSNFSQVFSKRSRKLRLKKKIKTQKNENLVFNPNKCH